MIKKKVTSWWKCLVVYKYKQGLFWLKLNALADYINKLSNLY